MVRDIIRAKGHKNITARHRSTFQITKDQDITKRADCIIAVSADKSVSDLSNELKNAAKKDDAKIFIKVIAGNRCEIVEGTGCEKLELTDAKDIVIRKSDFVSERTLMIKADRSAADFDLKLIENLKEPHDVLIIVDIMD